MASILIIDDDSHLRSLLRVLLEKAGHEVAEAADGTQGLKAYRERHDDMVICDILMPEMDGLQTIRELQNQSPGVKILAMSGGTLKGTMDFLPFATKLGAVATLHKPFALRELLEVVEEMLGRPV